MLSRQGMKPRPVDVAIVGLGLIGGSLAKVLSRRGQRVIGVDRPEVLKRAKADRAIVDGSDALHIASAARLIVLAAPPRANLAALRKLSRIVPPGTVITDLGSVKGPICRAARALGLRSFVGGHPMAGRERSGFENADPELFRGHPWILTPEGAPKTALAAVTKIVRLAGAKPCTMRAAEHDRTVAFLSHVPQLVAWALDGAARGDRTSVRHLDLAGPGFRDMTRLARSPRPLWREILAENRNEVARALSALSRALRRRV
jgi:prephenate dehydrogenase